MTTLPEPLRAFVENAYGIATAELFFWATPFALLALIAVLFIEEKPLKTTTSTERLAEESTIAAGGRALPTPADTPVPTSPRRRPEAVEGAQAPPACLVGDRRDARRVARDRDEVDQRAGAAVSSVRSTQCGARAVRRCARPGP